MADKQNLLPVGLSYAQSQLAKTLSQPEINNNKVQQWEAVLHQILQGQANYGSRTPFENTPAWITLEVIKGGFATGNWLAGGEITPEEQHLLDKLQIKTSPENQRLALNSYYLTDEGMNVLNKCLDNENYLISVPEESVLLTVAWLIRNKAQAYARDLLDIISPWFSVLRFYPHIVEQPVISSSTVRVQELAMTIYDLKRIKPLWRQSAKDLLAEYFQLRKQYFLCNKPIKNKGDFAKLRIAIEQLSLEKNELELHQAQHIRVLLQRHIEKYGEPNSEKSDKKQKIKQDDVQAPLHYTLSRVILNRFDNLDINNGFDDKEIATEAISESEAKQFSLTEDYPIPSIITYKTMRSFNTTASQLIEQKLITSSEALSNIIPQITAGLRANSLLDIPLRHLYEKNYRAFKQRRSLLLLD